MIETTHERILNVCKITMRANYLNECWYFGKKDRKIIAFNWMKEIQQ